MSNSDIVSDRNADQLTCVLWFAGMKVWSDPFDRKKDWMKQYQTLVMWPNSGLWLLCDQIVECGQVVQCGQQWFVMAVTGSLSWHTTRVKSSVKLFVQWHAKDMYRVGQKKPYCVLTVCNSRMCWHRIAFYISNCSVLYPE